MKKISSYILLVLIGLFPVEMLAWQGMPTPPLHIEGNQLKDPTGKSVLLHGWMQPTETWFNGGGNRYSNPTDWTDVSNVAGMLNFLKDAATVMSDVSPKYGQTHGWYTSFVRMNTDAIGGWTQESGLVDQEQFDGWIQNFLVPYANHLKSRGLYLVLSATGPINTPDNGSRNAGVTEQARLRTFWSTVANAPGVKNADNIMFELMNEPVEIESSPGNGDWGLGQSKYFRAFRDWMQPVIDDIRNTGANNVIWVPTLEWQGSPQQWVEFPFSGSNIGVAAHYYPAYGGCYEDLECHDNLWNRQYKPAADLWPMMISEMMWFPYEGEGYDNLFRGTTAVFGNAVKNAIDTQGNVSFLVGFLGDHLVNLAESEPADAVLGSHEGTQSYFEWLPTYTWAAPDDGTPKFKDAFVTDNNPEQLQLVLSHPLRELSNYDGFTVKVGDQVVEIDRVVLANTAEQLVIHLNESVLKDDEIVFSYSEGNVASIYEKDLANFNDILVDNLLRGAAPRIIELSTNEDGDTLKAKFNMKMQVPSDLSALNLSAEYDGNKTIPILKSSIFNKDSTVLAFSLDEQVYGDYQLLLSYTGSNIISADDGALKTFSDLPVTNESTGLPLEILAGKIEPDGISVVLEFSKYLAIAVGQEDNFTLQANGENVAFEEFFASYNTIRFTLSDGVHYDDAVTLSYTPGNIEATDNGKLEGFSDYPLENMMSVPDWFPIPGKIEAEEYYLHSGIETEQTGDEGGGLNVGWIDSGDWLMYALESNSPTTEYEITFRLASPNTGIRLDLYLDNINVGQINVPNTSGWQSWESVVEHITLDQGQHYLKIVAPDGGFNINYLEIKQSEPSSITSSTYQVFDVYPNPASDKVMIKSKDFRYSKVEILDIMGKPVLSRSVAYESELYLPVSLTNGLYILKISNEKEYQRKRIIIANE